MVRYAAYRFQERCFTLCGICNTVMLDRIAYLFRWSVQHYSKYPLEFSWIGSLLELESLIAHIGSPTNFPFFDRGMFQIERNSVNLL